MVSQELERGASEDVYADLRSVLNEALAEAATMPLTSALERVAEAARTVMGCRYAAIVTRDPDGKLTHYVPGGDDDPADIGRLPSLDGLLSTVIYDGVTLRIPDITLDPRMRGLSESHPPLRELLAVPIRSAGQVIGGLFLSAQNSGRPFRADAEHGARTIATAAGFLIDHSRMATQIARRERWLTVSNELTRDLVSGAHANPMQALVDRLIEIAEVQLAVVVMPSVDGQSLIVTSVAGERAAEVSGRVVPREGTLADVVLDQNEPLFVSLSGVDEARDIVATLGLTSALMVPLTGVPGQGGVLGLYRADGEPAFSQTEVEMATTLAAQMALSMELARARADRERSTLLKERDRIARDLHDHIIQQLFATGMALQSTATQVDREASDRIYKAIDELDQTILQIRSTIYRLSAPADSSGLRQRIDQVIGRVEEPLGFPVDVDISGPIDFGVADDVAYDVLAVLQETLTNVAKHAGATSVHVSISLHDASVSLVIADNGRGIGEVTRRSGLANLRSRAEARGGTMTTETGSRGTRITWSVPSAG